MVASMAMVLPTLPTASRMRRSSPSASRWLSGLPTTSLMRDVISSSLPPSESLIGLSSLAARNNPSNRPCGRFTTSVRSAGPRSPRRCTGWLPATGPRSNWQHVLVIDLLMEMDRLALLAQSQVEDLDHDGEGHRKVDVPLRNMLSKSLGEERHPDQEEEAQRQNLHGWMAIHEIRQRLGCAEHDADRDHYRDHRNRDVGRHPDRGDHRVE